MVRPYELWIEGYYHMSGGIRALHVLKQELINRGMQAWMKYERVDNSGCIGVYPEIVNTNPENYEYISRWLLNTAELPEDGPIFSWAKNMGGHPQLTVNIFEMDLWKPYRGHRSGVGYWVGKGVKDERFIPDGAIEIHRGNFTTRQELAERIKTLDYLISFDVFTAVNIEAVLCGTPVLVRGEHKKMTQQEIIDQNFAPYGIAWSMADMPKARKEVWMAYEHYESLLPVFAKQIDNFVEITQNASS